MYVCIYVYMVSPRLSVFMCLCIFLSMYACMRVCMCECMMNACMDVWMHGGMGVWR